MLLRGLKEHTSNLTAVVTVADDGGSSGVLRHELGIPPVGDIRNCIAALADAEPLMSELLQYRFPETGDAAGEGAGLGGHAVGNLLIAAMTAVEGGDFEEGVRRINRILAVRGQVLPATATPLTLHARLADGSVIDGQSRIMRTVGIERVWLTPEDVHPSDDALAAIAEADLIVLGPGSLYTSLLPCLLIPGILDALLASSAPARLRLQRRDPGGRDRPATTSPHTSRRSSPTRRRASSTSSSRTTTSRPGPRTTGTPSRSACAGRRRSTRSRASSSRTSSMPTTRTITIRHA